MAPQWCNYLGMSPGDHPPRPIDVTVPSPARVYDYTLGGTHHYQVDREMAESLLRDFPELRPLSLASRQFLGRAVEYLAGEGIKQFLDLGSGLPTQDNVHQIAQRADGHPRVLYVDNDPIVLAHGQALLAEDDSTSYAQADLRDVDDVLGHARGFLDWDRPVGLLCVSVLHYVPGDPRQVMERYVQALPAGSFVVVGHISPTGSDPAVFERAVAVWRGRQHPRPVEQIEAMFSGALLVEPGLVPVESWRPAPGGMEPGPVRVLGGVARKEG